MKKVLSKNPLPNSELAIEWWPIAKPTPYKQNARKIPQRAIDKVATSLREFGWRQPIVVNSKGVILAGHTRLLAAKQLGMVQIPVHVAGNLTAAQERAYRLMDNRSHEETGWDDSILLLELGEIKGLNIDLSFTGFDVAQINKLFPARAAAEDDAPPLPVAPVSQLGDVWLLGRHRLMCGDSTDADAVAHLMDGKKASLLATDPPYLVDYQGGNHPQSWANKPDVKDKHWDDYSEGKGVELYTNFLRIGLLHSIERVPVYQWHVDLRRSLVEQAWAKNGMLLHQIIVWSKARPVLTRSHFMWQHEPCAYGWVKGMQPKARPPASEKTIWSVDCVGETDGIHPTQKPVELFRRAINFHTEPDHICYEPFSGSGTMIAACELTGRSCRAMELSPAFVDVAVIRWQELTGEKATLEGAHGQTFAQAKAGRRLGAEDAIKEEILGGRAS